MIKKTDKPKLNFNIVHDMAVAFASGRMSDYKYQHGMNPSELREARYSNFLTDYAYVISQYQKAVSSHSENPTPSSEKPLNVSITLFDSLIKLESDSN